MLYWAWLWLSTNVALSRTLHWIMLHGIGLWLSTNAAQSRTLHWIMLHGVGLWLLTNLYCNETDSSLPTNASQSRTLNADQCCTELDCMGTQNSLLFYIRRKTTKQSKTFFLIIYRLSGQSFIQMQKESLKKSFGLTTLKANFWALVSFVI